jgi:hypothetical protein
VTFALTASVARYAPLDHESFDFFETLAPVLATEPFGFRVTLAYTELADLVRFTANLTVVVTLDVETCLADADVMVIDAFVAADAGAATAPVSISASPRMTAAPDLYDT